MKREFLQGLELEKDVIDQIMAEYGKDINAEKSKYQQIESEKQALESQLEEAKATIDGFKSKDLDIEKITNLAKEWETKYQKAEEQRQADLKAHALLAELNNTGTVDVDLLKSCLDENALIYKDGAFIGLTEQVDKLKESKPYLFVDKSEKKQIKGARFDESSDGATNDEPPADLSKMSYPEACAYLESHKE